MIDIHTHILPGIDDGAADKKESAALVEALKKQGASLLVLTPHFYSDRESLSDFAERRAKALKDMPRVSGIEYRTASETYLSEALFVYDSLDALCIQNTGVLLLELPYGKNWEPRIFRQIDRLMGKFGIKPVIAHAERYEAVRKHKKEIFRELLDIGCLLQFNADSLLLGSSRFETRKLLRDGWGFVLGSDCHNMTSRPPRLFDARELVIKKLGTELWDTLQKNAESLLS